jgi:acetolactate synthase-1/2/3 large subunit
MLRTARKPVILAGIAALRARAGQSVARLAEAMSVPVVVSPMAKGVLPEDHPLFCGVLDMACNKILWGLLESADLIVSVGFDAVELIKPWPAQAPPVLYIDSVPNTDQILRSQCECVGDVAAITDWLAGGWTGEARWDAREIRRHQATLRDGYYQGRVKGRLNPTDVVDAVREHMPRQTIATCDVGSHKLLVGQGWTTYEPRTMLMTNGLSSMGFGVPAAIAASLVCGQQPVVALVGDGGFAMTATEVRLAAALRLPVLFVVFVDGSLNRIELKQMAAGLPSTATRIEDMDLVSMAEAMDCDGARADSEEDLRKVLHATRDLSRPMVIEARIDPSQYAAQF